MNQTLKSTRPEVGQDTRVRSREEVDRKVDEIAEEVGRRDREEERREELRVRFDLD